MGKNLVGDQLLIAKEKLRNSFSLRLVVPQLLSSCLLTYDFTLQDNIQAAFDFNNIYKECASNPIKEKKEKRVKSE